ncbi:MAG: hypothetical protein Q7K65_04325 [Candidatus Buchananbacteria bacterium]|nr:hypothetical protein [Candidatus Buchananbacteria bacterium]
MDCQMDTGQNNEFYFIKTNVWLSVVSTINGMLCVGCLEKRLKRQLRADDFTSASINSPKHGAKSLRLLDRLTKK